MSTQVICIANHRPTLRMPEAVFAEAVALHDKGDRTGAALIYKEYAHSDERAAVNLGTIWYDCNDFKNAAVLYHKATRLKPDYPTAWFNLGNALDELNRPAKAIEAYEKALRLCPQYADCLFNLALVLCQTGQRRRSIKYWAAYAKIDRSGIHHTAARAKIKQILNQDFLAVV